MGHEIALVDTFYGSVEGLFHDLVLVEEPELLNDGAPETVNLIAGVYPPCATTAKLLLQTLAEMGGEDVALDEGVAEIGNADGPTYGVAVGKHPVEMIHTAGLPFAVVVDKGDALRPVFLNRADA